jgi:hypothetical protein
MSMLILSRKVAFALHYAGRKRYAGYLIEQSVKSGLFFMLPMLMIVVLFLMLCYPWLQQILDTT